MVRKRGSRGRASSRETPSQSARLQQQQRHADNSATVDDPQLTSPFFHPEKGLPPEIRHIIFTLAVTSYEDMSMSPKVLLGSPRHHLWDEPAAENRPGYFYPRRIDTALLSTCRRIYRETRLLPVAINTHALWYNVSCTGSYPPTTSLDYFRPFTSEQLAAVQHVHIFADCSQLGALHLAKFFDCYIFAELSDTRKGRSYKSERRPYMCVGLHGPYPQTLTITVRDIHRAPFWADINNLETEKMLDSEDCENVFRGLKILRIELEAIVAEKASLDPMVQRLNTYTFDIGNGEELVAEQNVSESTWKNPFNRGTGHSQSELEDTDFYVVTTTWKAQAVGKRAMVQSQAVVQL